MHVKMSDLFVTPGQGLQMKTNLLASSRLFTVLSITMQCPWQISWMNQILIFLSGAGGWGLDIDFHRTVMRHDAMMSAVTWEDDAIDYGSINSAIMLSSSSRIDRQTDGFGCVLTSCQDSITAIIAMTNNCRRRFCCIESIGDLGGRVTSSVLLLVATQRVCAFVCVRV